MAASRLLQCEVHDGLVVYHALTSILLLSVRKAKARRRPRETGSMSVRSETVTDATSETGDSDHSQSETVGEDSDDASVDDLLA